MNECASTADHTCSEHAECLDIEGGFKCGRRTNEFFLEGRCNAGWSGDGQEKNCTDIDECTETACLKRDPPCTVCPDQSTCTNTLGSFSCPCSVGFEHPKNELTNEAECVNVEECAAGTNNCDKNAQCLDAYGSFTCDCKPGWVDSKSGVSNGTACKNENECQRDDACPNAKCTDTQGSFECTCNEGFVKDPFGTCTDILECEDPSVDQCAVGAVCNELPGSFECVCGGGWSGDGKQCVNIDECKVHRERLDTGNVKFPYCHQQADCVDSEGSFECQCNDGWTGTGLWTTDGKVGCEDIDECAANIDGKQACPETNMRCLNLEDGGGYDCECKRGYQMELPANRSLFAGRPVGSSFMDVRASKMDPWVSGYCYDVDECQDPKYKNACEVWPEAFGPAMISEQPVCHNKDGSFDCDCPQGYNQRENKEDGTKVCEDVDECNNDVTNECHKEASCNNTIGDYTCACDAGWVGDGYSCENVDECAAEVDPCAAAKLVRAQTQCTDTNGSYFCNCDPADGRGCDAESCALGWDETCHDTDECKTTCKGAASMCVNKPGAYDCKCNLYWEKHPKHDVCLLRYETFLEFENGTELPDNLGAAVEGYLSEYLNVAWVYSADVLCTDPTVVHITAEIKDSDVKEQDVKDYTIEKRRLFNVFQPTQPVVTLNDLYYTVTRRLQTEISDACAANITTTADVAEAEASEINNTAEIESSIIIAAAVVVFFLLVVMVWVYTTKRKENRTFTHVSSHEDFRLKGLANNYTEVASREASPS